MLTTRGGSGIGLELARILAGRGNRVIICGRNLRSWRPFAAITHSNQFLPARIDKTLWCGYVIESEERLVYFAGDMGFGPHFAQIREKFGPRPQGL